MNIKVGKDGVSILKFTKNELKSLHAAAVVASGISRHCGNPLTTETAERCIKDLGDLAICGANTFES